MGEQQPPPMLLSLDGKQASTHTLISLLNPAGPFPALHGAYTQLAENPKLLILRKEERDRLSPVG